MPHEVDEAIAPLELLHPLGGARHLDAAGLVVHAELAVLPGAVDGEGRHLLRVVGQEDEVRRVARGAAGTRQRALLEQHDVPPAMLGEVVGHAVADDAGADDDDIRPRRKRAHADLLHPRCCDVPAEDTRDTDPRRGTRLDRRRGGPHPRAPPGQAMSEGSVASLFIDGAWVASGDGTCSPVINPCDGTVVTEVDVATDEQVQAAIAAARRAFDATDWPRTPTGERAALLDRVADLLERDLEELAREETLNTGKAMRESRFDIADVIRVFRYYADLADEEAGRLVDTGDPTALSRIVYEPVGVCGLIGPWNYPLLQLSWKIAPALAAGYTAVMKPAHLTPLTAIHLTRLLEEAGVPRGVVNLVLGAGRAGRTGAGRLAADVDLISLTGGIEAGRALMRGAAVNVKKVALELGGKSPNIVFADADFETAVDNALTAAFVHSGQVCSAGCRAIVEAPIHDRFVAAIWPSGRTASGWGVARTTRRRRAP